MGTEVTVVTEDQGEELPEPVGELTALAAGAASVHAADAEEAAGEAVIVAESAAATADMAIGEAASANAIAAEALERVAELETVAVPPAPAEEEYPMSPPPVEREPDHGETEDKGEGNEQHEHQGRTFGNDRWFNDR